MTKDVLVSIAGLQYEVNEGEAIEIISHGEYYFRNNKHFLRYEEITDTEAGLVNETTSCTLKITPEKIDLIKKGASNVHMLFEKNKNHLTYYNTPFGDLMVGTMAKSIDIIEEEAFIMVQLTYELDINYEYFSDCTLTIKIFAKPETNA